MLRIDGILKWGALVILIAGSSFSKISVSASPGSVEILEVPLGKDSVYNVGIQGVNKTEQDSVQYRFEIIPRKGNEFLEKIPNIDFLELTDSVLYAPAQGNTNSVSIITSFPEELQYANRRFSADVIASTATRGFVGMAVAIKVSIETVSRRNLDLDRKKIMMAPIKTSFPDELDSLLLYNGTDEPESVIVYWSEVLSGEKPEKPALRLFRKLIMWNVPANEFELAPGQKEWIFFNKYFDYKGTPGYIICKTTNGSLYCRLVRTGSENCE